MFKKIFTKRADEFSSNEVCGQLESSESPRNLGSDIFERMAKLALVWSAGTCGVRCIALLAHIALTVLVSYLFSDLLALVYVIAILSMVIADWLVFHSIFDYARLRLSYSTVERWQNWKIPSAWTQTLATECLLLLMLSTNCVSMHLIEVILHGTTLASEDRILIGLTVTASILYIVTGYVSRRRTGLKRVIFYRTRRLL